MEDLTLQRDKRKKKKKVKTSNNVRLIRGKANRKTKIKETVLSSHLIQAGIKTVLINAPKTKYEGDGEKNTSSLQDVSPHYTVQVESGGKRRKI